MWALVANSDCGKWYRRVEVKVYIDALRVGKQVHDLYSHKIYHYSTSNQEYHQPDKPKSTAKSQPSFRY